MDTIEALRRAGEGYRDRLEGVRSDQWDLPSVCDGWTVSGAVTGDAPISLRLLDRSGRRP